MLNWRQNAIPHCILASRPVTRGTAGRLLRPQNFEKHVYLLGITASYNHFAPPRNYRLVAALLSLHNINRVSSHMPEC